MKTCFIITGLLRNFSKKLYIFLCRLETILDFDVYIYTSSNSSDMNYNTDDNIDVISDILKNKRYKLVFFDNTELDISCNMSKKEQGILYQWDKFKKCFTFIPDIYDIYIRVRPDIDILITINEFNDILKNINISFLYIPEGSNRFSINSINDQFAIGSYNYIKEYAAIYDIAFKKKYILNEQLISETILWAHLIDKKIPIKRFNFPYKLCLSDCSLLAICGDSSTGKSTIINAIQDIFPFDSKLVIETDRYHKWERNNYKWNTMTHLNPEANYLEKLIDDSFQLKIGNSVYAVNYNHTNGEFTGPEKLESTNLIMLCGLHTLYKEQLRNQIDLKIYIEADEHLKTFWKVKRDCSKRGYSVDDVLSKIHSRKEDFKKYIEPQKEHANLIIRYSYSDILELTEDSIDYSKLNLYIECDYSILPYCYTLLSVFSTNSSIGKNRNTFIICKNIHKEQYINFLQNHTMLIVDSETIQSNYIGFIQILILTLYIHSV